MKLYSFYNLAKKDPSLARIDFDKLKLDSITNEFLTQLVNYISNVIHSINEFKKCKRRDKNFINLFTPFIELYSFLKKNECNFRNKLYSEYEIDELTILKIYDVQKTKEKLIGIDILPLSLGLTKFKETITMGLNVSEIFESIIKILSLLLYILDEAQEQVKAYAYIEEIVFEIYEHIVPNHFEDMDQESLGLISQIKFSGNNQEV